MQLKWYWLAVPFVVVGVGSRALVGTFGDSIARAIAASVGDLPRAPDAGAAVASITDAIPLDLDAGTSAGTNADASAPADAGTAKDAGKAARASTDADDGGDAGPLKAYVPLAAVEKALDDQGQSLRGRTLWAGGKPRGVRLTGVSSMGVGLKDGDVIVEVDGKPAMDDDTATDLALGVVARGDRVLHATLIRGDRPIDLTLELPKDSEVSGSRR